MRILDDNNNEITDPDLKVGELRIEIWASPEAYKSIDNETKFALEDDDYEEIYRYHVWTDEEVKRREYEAQMREQEARQKEFAETAPSYMNALTSSFGEVE